MANILKSVAIAAGAGLALGLTSISGPGSVRTPVVRRQPHPSPTPGGDDILNLEPLLDRLEVLERRIELAQRQTAQDVARDTATLLNNLETTHQRQLNELRLQLPGLVAASLDADVAGRIESFEQTLAAQASSISALSERVHLTDANLQRLVTAIERLVDGPPAPGPAAANSSFQEHFDEALRTGPDAPALVGPHSRMFQEPQPQETRKRRFPMSRFF